ncbi:MAG: efflux RND transporter periplasmic adaptor subunit [Calditrichaeota bacterium]|nr:MAG: efflux RND transporter periplasmic adaptor subunit [Calditrichota bacterium]MBL1207184.1 efflux RND transporter periplasmic adaptor subunit [Calditrichota bacterium]NOG47017.1 efflux RND transporter periplasmic adaptor subunit [Calditrichota bacterium]
MKQSFKRLLIFSSLFIPLIFISCGSDESEQKAETANMETADENQLWTCGMHPEVILDEPGQCPKCGMNLVPVKNSQGSQANTATTSGERKILYWQAPMNPTEIYDKPGKSNMGMDLVPVYEGETSSGSSVSIDPTTVQNMGVRFAPVERTDFSRIIRTVGKVDYNEEKIYAVSTKVSGWIEKLYVDYTGKEVRKNQPLLEIYSPELVTTQQEYLLALKNKELISDTKYASIKEGAESLLNSTRQRLLYWDIPESEIKKLEKRGTVKKTLTLESPASGVVIHKNAVEGLHVKEGSSLYQIADLSKIWVYVSIYDNEVPWIKIGQKAEMELSYLPGKKLEGQVSYIYPYLSDKARDIKVRLEFPNPGLELKPGMYTNVTIETSPIPDAIVVPTEAVIRSGQRNVVFISREEGRFEPREVIVGEESASRQIRILSGLLGNEKVVVSAQFLLDSESRLQEAIQKMLAEKSNSKKDKPEMEDDETMDDHSSMETEKNPDMEEHDHSNMDETDEHKMNNDEGAEMKYGGDMDMGQGKNATKKSEKEGHENSGMKCGDGMDMEETKKSDKEKDKEEHDNSDH